jgi:hypothetical protein
LKIKENLPLKPAISICATYMESKANTCINPLPVWSVHNNALTLMGDRTLGEYNELLIQMSIRSELCTPRANKFTACSMYLLFSTVVERIKQ